MIRPLISKIKSKEDSLIFQVLDWNSYDIEDEDQDENSDQDEDSFIKNRKFIIRAYGVTEHGNSISVHIKDFTPYFFFKIPQNWTQTDFNTFMVVVQNRVSKYHKDSLISFEIVERKEFYGFTNNKLFKFGRLVFKNINAFYSYQKILKTKIKVWRLSKVFDFSKSLYEIRISPLLRFFHVKGIKPAGWVELPAGSYTLNTPSKSRCQIDATVHYNEVKPLNLNKVARFTVASFDIECTSKDGSFPNPNRKEDQIIQIGTTVYEYGSSKCLLKHIVTLKNSDSIDDAIVESFNNERDVILGWAKFIQRLDPDILTGYNIWGFDQEYMYERAKSGNGGTTSDYSDILLRKLHRLENRAAQYKIKELSSSALGNNFLKYIEIEGIVQIDLLKLIQKDHKLSSYKLDNVATHFMKQKKLDLPPKEIFSNYKLGTPEKIKEIAVYCLMDCVLCNNLINKLNVIPNNIGMANVCCVPLSYLFMRGQGIKIFSLVAQQCRLENFVVKELSMEDIDTNSYEGAIVFHPKPGIYFDPITVMDYAALYPSSMISENISHDSIVGYTEYQGKENSDEYEQIDKKINSEYDNLPDYNYIDIKYDTFQGIGDDKKKIGYKSCRFAEHKSGKKSVLPRILMGLLKARKDTRGKIKYKKITCKGGSEHYGILRETDTGYVLKKPDEEDDIVLKENVLTIEDKYNEYEKIVLDGEQMAYKTTSNSLYGQVGSSTSQICYKELAACTTATGRNMVTIARDITLKNYPGSSLTYGDTDSIFINFKGYLHNKYGTDLTEKQLLEKSIEVGQEAGALVTSHLKSPQNLEYEKVFHPFIIFSKKRYVGNKYEFSTEKFKQTSMGIVLKRRDNADIVKDIYGGIIDIILNNRDLEKSKLFFRDEVDKLLKGDVDVKKLVISKSIRSEYKNPTQIAHKVLAERIGERDPGNKPVSSDRIPYCYIAETCLKCSICNCKVKVDNCKCVSCMKLFCNYHLKTHKNMCHKICRFCKLDEKKCSLENCKTCFGWYCKSCFTKHKKRKDKYDVVHEDKCKKPITTKILQGDRIEHPEFIKENKLLIDYRYYFEHQIKKPVYQIFELNMKKPETIVADILRKDENLKKGVSELTKWFKIIEK